MKKRGESGSVEMANLQDEKSELRSQFRQAYSQLWKIERDNNKLHYRIGGACPGYLESHNMHGQCARALDPKTSRLVEMQQSLKEQGSEARKRVIKLGNKFILETLTSEGIPADNIWTNGYAFNLSHRDKIINFVNQDERLVGSMYGSDEGSGGMPTTGERSDGRHDLQAEFKKLETEFISLRDWERSGQKGIAAKGRINDFQRRHDYREFVFYGHPASTAKKVLGLAELPIEKVLRLQSILFIPLRHGLDISCLGYSEAVLKKLALQYSPHISW